jgi:multiple sugar transport system substrate-binding protein
MTAVLGGCGLGSGSDEVTLRLVAADYGDSSANSSQKYWDKLIKEYEAEHSGVKIDVSVYSWTDVDRKVKELVDAGKAPDMAQIGAYADYADKGLLYKADDLIGIREQADFVAQLGSPRMPRRSRRTA